MTVKTQQFRLSARHKSVAKLLGYILVCVLLFTYIFHSTTTTSSSSSADPSAEDSASERKAGGLFGFDTGKKANLAPVEPPIKRKKAAMVSLVRNSNLYGMRKTIQQLEDRFNRKYNYPYIFLNDEPFTEEFKRGVRDLTSANVTFGTLSPEAWGYPDWIDLERARKHRETANYMHSKSESYRFMCRFQSGYIYRHDLLKDLDFYWRIEPDVNYFCELPYDPFLFMQTNNKKYGWNMAPNEYMATIPTLWKTTQQFMKEYPHHIPEKNLLNWVINEKTGEYNGCHFWTNFEIVDLSFYRSQAYTDYFNYLDKAGGFFYERWGDAPVHTLAVAMFLNKQQVHYFSDIGYYHPAMGFCPKGSDIKGKCVCDPNEHNEMAYGCRRSWDTI